MLMDRDSRYQLTGWGLFTLSAVLYAISSIESESWSGLMASVIFLIACVVFLIPLLWRK